MNGSVSPATLPLPLQAKVIVFLLLTLAQDRKVWLVDKDSGEMLANNIGQAQHLGLIKKREKRETKEEKEVRERPREKC